MSGVSGRAGSVLRCVGGLAGVRSSVRRLSLFLCTHLSDADVLPVESFSSLTTIDVGGCHGLTDEALRWLIGSGANESGKRRALQWLSLYWCPGMTDKGIGYLSAGLDCAALRHLSLRSVQPLASSRLQATQAATAQSSGLTSLVRRSVFYAVAFATRATLL